MKIQIILLLLTCVFVFPKNTNAQEMQSNFKKIIAEAKEKVFPALVFVKPIVEVFYSGKKEQQQVFGSGVIISPDGYVVTNNHVAQDAKSIKCVLSDKRQVIAQVIGLDKETDLALLKLNLPPNSAPLPYAKFGDSDTLEEGQFVMAMGSPFGFSRSISFGIVSYTRRYLSEGPFNLWIQTDAAINPGNSGGPLVDDKGHIIGINTLGAMMADNIAFSIPSNTVKNIVDILKMHGEIKRTWTGITFQALRDYSLETIIEGDTGVLVASVDQSSPAGEAGIQTGDIILSCGGVELQGVYVEDLPLIRSFFAMLPNDGVVTLQILRNNKTIPIVMNLKAKGKIKGDDLECDLWDMTLKGINKFATPNIAFFQEEGVFVQGVQSQGNAQSSGLMMGDIILEVDQQKVDSLEKIENIYHASVKKSDAEKKILLKILRQGLPLFVILDYRLDYKDVEEH